MSRLLGEFDHPGRVTGFGPRLVHAEVPVQPEPEDSQVDPFHGDQPVDASALGVEVGCIDIDPVEPTHLDVVEQLAAQHRLAPTGMAHREPDELVEEKYLGFGQ